MTDIHYLFALLGAILLIANVAVSLSRNYLRSRTLLAAAGAIAAALSVIPIGQASAASWVLGIIDPLSITTMAILAYGMANVLGFAALPDSKTNSEDVWLTAIVLIVAALGLYPASLGALSYDPYALGYGGFALPVMLSAPIAYSAWRNCMITPGLIALALAAWHLQLLESTNLWDYLLDPLAPALALAVAIRNQRALATRRVA